MVIGILPSQKTGKDFLASSHFTLGMDKETVNDYQINSHKIDYPPIELNGCRPKPVKEIADSYVMHSNTKVNKLPVSHTKDSFQNTGEIKRERGDYSDRLNTNFLSHSDNRCLSFKTSNSEHFTLENALNFDRQPQKSLMTSTVPCGDTENVPLPESEVHGNFKPQDISHVIPTRYPNYKDGKVIDTLRTDRRFVPSYSTNYMEKHSNDFLPAKKQVYGEAARKRGDHSIVNDEVAMNLTSNVMASYGPTHFTNTRYNKKETVSKVHGTTFLFGSEAGTEGSLGENYKTTSQHYHSGQSCGISQSMKPDNVFHSDFPEGDRHPERTRVIQNYTSHGEHFQNLAPGIVLNPKVRGEEIITKSNVVIGTDKVKLSASTQSCYVPQTEHIKPRERVDQLVKFKRGFELGDPANLRTETSIVRADFKHPEVFQKFQHNPEILSRLKDSHVSLSHDMKPDYTTTYKALFYGKKSEPQSLAPRLQTSTVPIGTFSRYMTNPSNPR